MKISFNSVMPVPLASIEHSDKSIWGNDFTLNKGEKVVLNASSGKGKTTFTHTLAGIRKDFDGDILFDNQSLKTISPEEWAILRKEKISFVFQDLQLFPKLTVAENLRLKNSLTNTYNDDQLKHFLSELDILDKWEVKSELLSMGQQQRVAIIRALTQSFDWLIMDEPFSHLDEVNTQKCLKLIDNRASELGAGFILTTLGDYHQFEYNRELNL
ncbi:MAG: ABC transporter [Fluviicola sp.]|nr:MAG: ABC transporter [Fluviicola sp.]